MSGIDRGAEHALSRRSLLGGALAAGVGLELATLGAAGEQAHAQGEGSEPSGHWEIVQGGTVLASFARLRRIERVQAPPTRRELRSARSDRPPPGSRRLPQVSLAGSKEVAALRRWHERALERGPHKAVRNVQLVGYDRSGAVRRRLALTNAFPARLGIDTLRPGGPLVQDLVLACTGLRAVGAPSATSSQTGSVSSLGLIVRMYSRDRSSTRDIGTFAETGGPTTSHSSIDVVQRVVNAEGKEFSAVPTETTDAVDEIVVRDGVGPLLLATWSEEAMTRPLRQVARRVDIVLTGSSGDEVATWELEGAFPSDVTQSFDIESSDVTYESVRFVAKDISSRTS